jgi:hypothetical protein
LYPWIVEDSEINSALFECMAIIWNFEENFSFDLFLFLFLFLFDTMRNL